MVIKDTRGREYTLTSTRLAEMHPIYPNIFSVTAKALKKALKNNFVYGVQFDAKQTDFDGRPLPETRWRLWRKTKFPFSANLMQIGCATFHPAVAKVIRKTMGIK